MAATNYTVRNPNTARTILFYSLLVTNAALVGNVLVAAAKFFV